MSPTLSGAEDITPADEPHHVPTGCAYTRAKTYMFEYDRRMSIAPRVLTSSEARTALPSLGAEIEREGIAFAPVFFGAHRKPVGAIVSVEFLDQLESLLEDVVIAPQIHDRIARGAGDASLAQIAEGLGLDPADFE